ncbi:MAG: hypothetical protein V2I35_06855, partial [Desulfocapsaceae bacterium]|nr:hypothetical protein [Desulfocapsaceae bacterium]
AFFNGVDADHIHRPDITWQSLEPGSQDWSAESRTLAFTLHRTGAEEWCDSDFFVMINGSREHSAEFTVPQIPHPGGNEVWRMIMDTAAQSPGDIVDFENSTAVEPGSSVAVPFMGLIVLQSG